MGKVARFGVLALVMTGAVVAGARHAASAAPPSGAVPITVTVSCPNPLAAATGPANTGSLPGASYGSASVSTASFDSGSRTLVCGYLQASTSVEIDLTIPSPGTRCRPAQTGSVQCGAQTYTFPLQLGPWTSSGTTYVPASFFSVTQSSASGGKATLKASYRSMEGKLALYQTQLDPSLVGCSLTDATNGVVTCKKQPPQP